MQERKLGGSVAAIEQNSNSRILCGSICDSINRSNGKHYSDSSKFRSILCNSNCDWSIQRCQLLLQYMLLKIEAKVTIGGTEPLTVTVAATAAPRIFVTCEQMCASQVTFRPLLCRSKGLWKVHLSRQPPVFQANLRWVIS